VLDIALQFAPCPLQAIEGPQIEDHQSEVDDEHHSNAEEAQFKAVHKTVHYALDAASKYKITKKSGKTVPTKGAKTDPKKGYSVSNATLNATRSSLFATEAKSIMIARGSVATDD
jgi:hypothetical protein